MTAPAHIDAGSNRGQENVGMEDVSIPRLDILQDLSPRVKKRDPSYVQGAEAGMLFNTVSSTLYGSSVYFVPVYYKKEFLIWKKQNTGGGFFGSFESKALADAEFRNNGYNDDYEIVDTAQQYGLIVGTDGSTEQIVCSMAKSKMKANRQLNTLCKMAGGDRFSKVYAIVALADKNPQGQDYWNLTVNALGYTPEAVYKEAEAMYEAIASGERTVNRAPTEPRNAPAKEEPAPY